MKSFNIKLVVSNSQTASSKREESVKSALEGYAPSEQVQMRVMPRKLSVIAQLAISPP